MGTAEKPTQAVLFIALMHQGTVNTGEVLDILKNEYGDIDRSFGSVQFSFTDYYKKEMGDDLQKMYLTFSRYIGREDLAAIKVFTNRIENRFCVSGKRTVNLDPGYVTRDKLVLASTKDFYHRIYLTQGIFAEVTLHYRKGMFRFFSWTYPDYKDPGFLAFLEKARARLVKTLRDEA
jgi:hypothetical protein